MTDTIFIPAADPGALDKARKAAFLTASELMRHMTADLDDSESGLLVQVLNGGGRVGIEMTLDKHRVPHVSVIAVELEGTRHVLAEAAADPPGYAEDWRACVRACCQLLELMDPILDADKREALFAVVEGGGNVGMELLVDLRKGNHAALIAIEQEGCRRQLANVVTIGRHANTTLH